jgi:hypothetical protein
MSYAITGAIPSRFTLSSLGSPLCSLREHRGLDREIREPRETVWDSRFRVVRVIRGFPLRSPSLRSFESFNPSCSVKAPCANLSA